MKISDWRLTLFLFPRSLGLLVSLSFRRNPVWYSRRVHVYNAEADPELQQGRRTHRPESDRTRSE